MNSLDIALVVCFNAVNIALLWLAWHFLWRKSCQERFRQKLFEVRDELFDLANAGQIAFHDSAYILLRLRINRMIRFSNRVGFVRVFTFICFQRYIGISEEKGAFAELYSAISEVTGKETKEALTRLSSKIDLHIQKHLLCISPQIILAAPLLLVINFLASSPKEKALRRVYNTRTSGVKIDPKSVGLRIIEAQAREAFLIEAFDRNTQNHHRQEIFVGG